ncbi:hypothetical protein [thiotrophic endosymbiont of Bathymodiolus puteoserpentis (Logatchev)]|jgi:curli biogenesis system outer membrane secretion channel CsgG|nr:hypothetical protein [thiotrophic endosymbiont of Bathymodiolus puteoserpentis (Logatchev)]
MKKLLLALPFSILLTACATEEVKPTSAPTPAPAPAPVDIIENPATFKTK